MTAEEIAELTKRAWGLYQNSGIPRITRTVDLHSAMFAYGALRGLRQVTPIPDAPLVIPVQVEQDLLRQVGVDLYVGGVATVDVAYDGTSVIISNGASVAIYHGSLATYRPGQGEPPGELWATAQNYGHIVDGSYTLLGVDILRTLLPEALVDPAQAMDLPGQAVAFALTHPLVVVDQMQRHFVWAVDAAATAIVPDLLEVDWYKSCYPAVPGEQNQRAMGTVYKIFRENGIDLARLRAETIGSLQQAMAAGLVSRATAEPIIESYS